MAAEKGQAEVMMSTNNNGTVRKDCAYSVTPVTNVLRSESSTTITMPFSPDSDSFDLLTAIRYDSSLLNSHWNSAANQGQSSPFLLLPYHFGRLIAAASQHGWQPPPSWSAFQLACQRAVESYNGQNRGGPLKVSGFTFPIAWSL